MKLNSNEAFNIQTNEEINLSMCQMQTWRSLTTFNLDLKHYLEELDWRPFFFLQGFNHGLYCSRSTIYHENISTAILALIACQ